MLSSGYFEPSDALIGRICRAYARVGSGTPGRVWRRINRRRLDIHEALTRGDRVTLARMFSAPGETFLYYGVDNLFAGFGDGGGLEEHARQTLAATTALIGEAATRAQYPTPFPGEFGTRTPTGVASYRAIQAVYQAAKVAQLAGPVASVLEIGGGMGRTCFHSIMAGASRYTIVDLPLTMVGQAVYLAATLGDDVFSLPGEAPGPVRLAVPEELDTIGRYDVCLNVDSFPEMRRADARRYFLYAMRNCGALLSINNENNTIYVRDFGHPAERRPFPLRAGYFEEVYRPGCEYDAGPLSRLARLSYRRAVKMPRIRFATVP